LTQNGFKEPKHTSTGTTIVGVKFKNGVILGADTRATAGTIIADKNCEKIHYIAPNIWYPDSLLPEIINVLGVQVLERQQIQISLHP
jgi:Proteasome subunit